jgi:hypothetical protein
VHPANKGTFFRSSIFASRRSATARIIRSGSGRIEDRGASRMELGLSDGLREV